MEQFRCSAIQQHIGSYMQQYILHLIGTEVVISSSSFNIAELQTTYVFSKSILIHEVYLYRNTQNPYTNDATKKQHAECVCVYARVRVVLSPAHKGTPSPPDGDPPPYPPG